MANRFIYTGKRYVNLDTVQAAQTKQNGRHQIVVDGNVIDDNNVDFGRTIVSVVAVQGEWECLRAEALEFILSEPVIAWGVTVLGEVVPITPGELGGVEGDFGLRKLGSPRVYSPQSIGGFANDKEWLAVTSTQEAQIS